MNLLGVHCLAQGRAQMARIRLFFGLCSTSALPRPLQTVPPLHGILGRPRPCLHCAFCGRLLLVSAAEQHPVAVPLPFTATFAISRLLADCFTIPAPLL